MNGLTLWAIEDSIAQLLQSRDETTDAEEVAAIDKALAEYVTREVSKVDRIHGLLQYLHVSAGVARQEATEYEMRARKFEEVEARIKESVRVAMEMAGTKVLNGTAGRRLVRKGNGGLAPLTVNLELLAMDFVTITAKIGSAKWKRMAQAWIAAGHAISELTDCITDRTPANARIREALAADPNSVYGARLEERGEHVEVK